MDINVGKILKTATETVKGVVELATSAEVLAGVDTEKAVTPAGFKAALVSPAMTGSATLNGTTNNTVSLSGIVTTLGLEVGDVIRIQYSGYNKLHTVESIIDDNSIIVNFEHAGNRGNGSLRLPDTTASVTITRIAKWFNAPVGLGQAWVNVKAIRAQGTTYTNTTGRTIEVKIIVSDSGSGSWSYAISGLIIIRGNLASGTNEASFVAPSGATYGAVTLNGNVLTSWMELR